MKQSASTTLHRSDIKAITWTKLKALGVTLPALSIDNNIFLEKIK